MKRLPLRLLPLVLACACGACAPVGPDYVRPDSPLPAGWKNAPAAPGAQWQPARPADAAPRQGWWQVFGDPTLDELENRALAASPGLQQAIARLDQARAQQQARSAAQSPSVQAGISDSRTRISADRPLSSYTSVNTSTIQNDLKPTLAVSYEFDWLGRIRRDVESARAASDQAVADLENVRLLLGAQVAGSYFQLRQYDAELEILNAVLQAQQRALALIGKRHADGASSAAERAQQAAQVEVTQAQRAQLQILRAQQENLLGQLVGSPAQDFSLAPGRLPAGLPAIPPGLPARLLERRPDIASAERAMAAANAQIGVAQAAYYPSLILTPASVGAEATRLADLGSAPALIWSLGIAASLTLFDGGRIDAGVAAARASYAASLAIYRQTVLTALREAQDGLDAVQGTAQAAARQQQAVQEQQRSYRISQVRYREGLDHALSLAQAEQLRLNAERSLEQLRGSQFQSSVALIKALGGGW